MGDIVIVVITNYKYNPEWVAILSGILPDNATHFGFCIYKCNYFYSNDTPVISWINLTKFILQDLSEDNKIVTKK